MRVKLELSDGKIASLRDAAVIKDLQVLSLLALLVHQYTY
jgi:hypothetical protein